jgi:hypothetical protein
MKMLICLTIGTIGTFIHFALRDIVKEMKRKNDLIEKQNEILKQKYK